MAKREVTSGEWSGEEIDCGFPEVWKPTKPGEKRRGVFIGMRKAHSPHRVGEFFDSAVFEMADGKRFCLGGAVLVEGASRLNPGDDVGLIYQGEGERKQGRNPPALWRIIRFSAGIGG